MLLKLGKSAYQYRYLFSANLEHFNLLRPKAFKLNDQITEEFIKTTQA